MRRLRPHGAPSLIAVICTFGLAAWATAAPALGAPPVSWSGALEVDHGASINAISCPSLGLCVAVDSSGRALTSTRPASSEGAAWSKPLALPGAGALSSISCPSDSLCVAVDRAGHALTSISPATGAWSSAFTIRGAGELTSVSCASASLCVAVTKSAKMSFSTNPTGGEGAWSEASSLPGMGELTSVSCPSASLCAAVDSRGDVAVTSSPDSGAASWNARLIDTGAGLESISCFAAACVAADATGDALASPDAARVEGAGTGSGATWSSTLVDLAGEPAGVSCSGAGLCALVDSAGYALDSDGPTAVPPSWSASSIDSGGGGLKGVSCSAAGICAAADGGGRVLVGLLPAPLATATGATSVSHRSATLTGTVNPQDATLGSCSFEYGLSTAYGSSVPCAGLGEGGAPQAVSAPVTGLTAGTAYHYRITLSDGRGASSSADSSFQTLAPYIVEPHPSIAGTPAAGQRLTCHSGVSATGVTITYQWLRDTGKITGASGSSYLVAAADASHHLQCRVTATTEEGSRSATSSFVTVPAGGVGTVIETSVGTPKASGDTVSLALRCSPSASSAGCTIRLRLTARLGGRTVLLGASTVRLATGQRRTASVSASRAGRRQISRHRRLVARLTVTGTVVGAINATLQTSALTLPAHGGAASVRRLFSAAAGPAGRAVALRRGRARAAGGATPAAVLSPTPYMGWDTYFTFGGHFDEASVLDQASQLRSRGLEADGYRYIWLDVDWWQGTRSPSGEITVSASQWPHGMAWLTSTLHAEGFKVGLYTDAGREGCGGPGQGSYGHYQQDVDTFAAWGFDAVKVDFCGGVRMGLAPAVAYAAFHQAIVDNSSHRPMLLSICDYLQPGQFSGETPSEENSAFASYTFGPSSGNSWRTDTDVGTPGNVKFEDVLRNLDADAAEPQAAGPGHWNDPDYLGPGQGMSSTQFRTQLGMWAMLAAPLMVSADMLSLSPTSQAILANREVIAIDQDPAGLQGRLLSTSGNGQVWVKPLSDGSVAVALLNRGQKTLRISTTAASVGLEPAAGYTATEVWSNNFTEIPASGTISFSVAGYSTTLLRIRAN